MNPATPRFRKLAKWLADREAAGGNPSEARVACLACEKLRHSLSILVGVAGFRALLSRALTLARAEVPWLKAVEVKEDGSLAGPDSLHSEQDRNEADRGGVVLLAQLLGLLDLFIGEALTLRLVGDIWPELPFDIMDSGMEEKR